MADVICITVFRVKVASGLSGCNVGQRGDQEEMRNEMTFTDEVYGGGGAEGGKLVEVEANPLRREAPGLYEDFREATEGRLFKAQPFILKAAGQGPKE